MKPHYSTVPPHTTPLYQFLATLPSGLTVGQAGRRAMGFLLRRQYAGQDIPDCKSARDLVNS